MTLAVLLFETRRAPRRVVFRCGDLLETRELEESPPFADWVRAYATGYWTREALLGIGLAMGNWLDGSQHWLTHLAQAPAPVTLVIETTKTPDAIEQAALDAPWELIARIGTERTSHELAVAQIYGPMPAPIDELMAKLGPVDWQYVHHAALEPSFLLGAVRRLGPSATPLAASKYRLSVVFMPCLPDGTAELSVDLQEVAIRKAAGGIGIELEVEDSGSLEGLGDLIARLGECDVIQVSCPATLSPRAALAFEGARGERVDTTAADIWSGIGQRPRLLIVHTYAGAAPGPAADSDQASYARMVAVGSAVLGPLSIELCQRGWPAVLSVPGAIGDRVEIDLAAALYRLLAQRLSLVEAFARARVAVASTTGGAVWHKARLLLGPGGGGQLVNSADARPTRPDVVGDPQFLDPARQIRIATDYQASRHRRAFQRVVATLRDAESPGIVVQGGDEPSRATFVSRVLQRVERELRRVVVTARFDGLTILQAVREQTAHPEVAALAKEYRGTLEADPQQLRDVLRAVIEGPCRDRGNGAFVLVLHNFELTSAPDHAAALRALLGAFDRAGTASRLLFTCTAPLSAVGSDGIDISKQLAYQSLDASAGSAAAGSARAVASHAEPSPSASPPAQTASDRISPLRWQRRRILTVSLGIALAGLVALLGVSWMRATAGPPPDSPMVRFDAADIQMGVFEIAALPKECSELPPDEDCRARHPESADIIHVDRFDLDRKEVTNADFCAWLNGHTNDWLPPGEDGLVRSRRDNLPLVQTKSCLDDLEITPKGCARPAASSAQRPVVCVTWRGADEYCRALGKRLPCEAEWELAAKGTEGRPFPWGQAPPHPEGVAYQRTLPRDVGTSAQDITRKGIYDLSGNVEEWVQSPRGTPEWRVVRGGSFLTKDPCQLLGSKCWRFKLLRASPNLGFRCARSVGPALQECPAPSRPER